MLEMFSDDDDDIELVNDDNVEKKKSESELSWNSDCDTENDEMLEESVLKQNDVINILQRELETKERLCRTF
jgi:hypothetical protein